MPDSPEGTRYISLVGYYEDKDCTIWKQGLCVYSHAGDCEGCYGCNAAAVPPTTPYYAKVEDTAYDAVQLVYTRDQSCPPNGPGAVFATLIGNAACVQMNLGGDAVGLSVFPQGGSGIARVASSGEMSAFGNDEDGSFTFEKRHIPQEKRFVADKRAAKCENFIIEDETPSSSQTVQISEILDCTNGAEAGCTISTETQYTESISTSFSVTAGGGIEGVFSVEATFGTEYTQEVTTSIQLGHSIPAGQRGYLSAYSAATLFTGRYTGCDEGDAEQPGQALVIKKNGFTYGVVLTGT